MNEANRLMQGIATPSVFGDHFDDLFHGFFRPVSRAAADGSQAQPAAIDIHEKNGRYLVKAELPGVNKDDIDVSIDDSILTIKAERKLEDTSKDEEGRVICRENRYGSFSRSVRLAGEIDVANVKASFQNGVLDLDIPLMKEQEPEKITIDIK